ncbi:MAG TPA: glycosyltransferase family 9 protein [bacterium]|nr:glycosyltransferase family 9 protein [bacterium]HPN30547.1 glycosyltransferase family 9 protein [bacterium]
MTDTEKKILIIRLGALGDIIRTMPSVKYLYENFSKSSKYGSNCKIYWLSETQNSGILENVSYIDKIIKLPRKEWQKNILGKNCLKVISEFINFIKELRKENFDYVLDFHGIFKSGLLSYLTKCESRIGFSKKFSKEFNSFFNNIHINAKRGKPTRIEKNFSLLSYFFKETPQIKEIPDIFEIKENDKTTIDDFLKKLKFSKSIIINPSVSKLGRYKEWKEDYYSELCGLLLNYYKDENLIFTGGFGEFEKIERIISGIKNISNDYKSRIFKAPEFRGKESAYLISKANLFITGDTAPMHIASFLNVPLIALFGPSDVEINKPFGSNNLLLYKPVGCNPCRKRKCKKLICQTALKPDYVFEKIISFYQK